MGDDGCQDVIGVIVAAGAGAVDEDVELRYAGRRITCPSDGARTGDAAQTASAGGMMVLVFAHGLGHPPARLGAFAQRLSDQLHLGIVERLAHGEAVVAGFGAGRADMDQEVAPAGHQLGRRAADFRAIDAQMRRPGVLNLPGLPGLAQAVASSLRSVLAGGARRPQAERLS